MNCGDNIKVMLTRCFCKAGWRKMLDLRKKLNKDIECTRCKKYCCNFFPRVCPLPHLFLHCDTQSRFGSMLWMFLTCYENMLCALWNINNMLCALWNIHNMEGYEYKTCPCITQFVLKNINGANGRLRGKNCSDTFVRSASNFFGRFNNNFRL
jgi:hypothetical protein